MSIHRGSGSMVYMWCFVWFWKSLSNIGVSSPLRFCVFFCNELLNF